MTEDPSRRPQLSAREILADQICHAENGKPIDYQTFRGNLRNLKPGTRLKIYRLAERDVQRRNAAVLEVEIKSIDPNQWKFVCDGQYTSSDPEEPPIVINSGICSVPITQDVIHIFGKDMGKYGLLLFKRQEENVLIFVQKDEAEAQASGNIGSIAKAVLDRLLKALRIRPR